MSKKGGYKIVSLGRLNLLGESLVLVGLYSALVNSYDKPIMLSDINIDGEIKKDALVQAEKGQNKVTIKNLYGYDLEISNEDAITVSESSLGIELPKPTPEDDGSLVGVNVQGKYVLKPYPLPDVTGADNGKVLEVIAGAWGKGRKKVNVIDAPASTTLTEDEFNIIKEGVFINGNFLGYYNPIMIPFGISGGGNRGRGILIGTAQGGSSTDIAKYEIDYSSYQISVTYIIMSTNNTGFPRSFDTLFGEALNKYPCVNIPSETANKTYVLKLINGAWTLVEEVA